MYIVIVDTQQVIANSKGVPREFPKMKKANNFMQGRPRLSEREWVFVKDVTKITGRLKVEL
jgi:hypothetical protein